jgi:DnaK suppressor protein
MKKQDLDEFKLQLQQLRARIRGDVEHITSGALDSGHDSKSPTHMAELGTETFEQDFSLGVMERDQGQLEEIETALKRINEGSYGVCQGCLNAGKSPAKAMIPKLRLKAVPFARECVECARKRERY